MVGINENTNELYCIYTFKYYLNARHYIITDGQKGFTHPHCWELSLDCSFPSVADDILLRMYNSTDELVNKFLEKYHDKVLNEIEPFTDVIPTLENITSYFAKEFKRILAENNGSLLSITTSETPTKSYTIKIDAEDTAYFEKYKDAVLDATIDKLFKEALS